MSQSNTFTYTCTCNLNIEYDIIVNDLKIKYDIIYMYDVIYFVRGVMEKDILACKEKGDSFNKDIDICFKVSDINVFVYGNVLHF